MDEPEFGERLPRIETEIPGPASVAAVDTLARGECPAITARRARRARESGAPQDPIVWHRARGANVEDVDGNVYVDLTSAFAVAGLGHGHPRVVAAAREQAGRLIHAMGDVYPSDAKVALIDKLVEVTPAGLDQTILGLSGASAIEAALKTAVVHTGRAGVLAFWGGYHGLSHGALAPTAYRDAFRRPFLGQLNGRVQHAPYPDTVRPPLGLGLGATPEQVGRACLAHLEQLLGHPAAGATDLGAVLIEPIQGRGGEVEPPPGFLAGLRELCDRHGLVLIFDEIYTGLARTGDMFACEREGVTPDILCLGKALGGGFPISAAVGTREVMASWGSSSGEAVHTSTFLGNPLGCAMATAALDVLTERDWPGIVRERGEALRERLAALAARHPDRVCAVRGRGFMLGLDLVTDPGTRAPDTNLALGLVDACRKEGVLVLPSGVHGNILAFSPPFVITDAQLTHAMDIIGESLARLV